MGGNRGHICRHRDCSHGAPASSRGMTWQSRGQRIRRIRDVQKEQKGVDGRDKPGLPQGACPSVRMFKSHFRHFNYKDHMKR
jgi:hypothetical protein